MGPPPQELLQKYDANQDGKLDDTERAAIRKDIEEGKLQPPPGMVPRGPRPPLPTAQQVLEKFDADQDGKLDESELNAFLTDMRNHRPPPPRAPMPPQTPAPPEAPSTQ